MRQRIKFTDERVCKSHLLNSCPHDILSGTVSSTVNRMAIHPHEVILDINVKKYSDCCVLYHREWIWESVRRSMT